MIKAANEDSINASAEMKQIVFVLYMMIAGTITGQH